jgi:hypothetical protein
MFESYYKILKTLQDIHSLETLKKSFYDWKLFDVGWLISSNFKLNYVRREIRKINI